MADVAEAAGLSRQTLYRVYESRPALLEFILSRRISEIGERLRPYFSSAISLREALVEGSLRSIAVGINDPLFNEIVEKAGERRLDQFLLRGNAEVQRLMLSLWEPILDRARASGELRAGLSNIQAVEWIRNVHGMLTLRDDYSEDERRAVLRAFVLPSLLAEP